MNRFIPGRNPAPMFALVAISGVAASIAIAAPDRLFLVEYEVNAPRIQAMDLDGSNASVLFAPPPSEWLLVGCAYDPGTGRIYWTHGGFNAGAISSAALDGSGYTRLLSGLKLPRGLALDLDAGALFWTDSPEAGNASGLVMRADLDGSNRAPVFTLSPYDPSFSFVGSPSIDEVNGYVYFCAASAIHRRALDGTEPVKKLIRGVTTVRAIAVDVAAGYVYFLDANTNSDYVGRARFDDTGFEVLVDITPGTSSSSGLFDLQIDTAGGKIYWTDELAGTVSRANLDGSGVEPIFVSLPTKSPTGLALNDVVVQPIEDCNGNAVRDLDDLGARTSLDCNSNGIPDECETRACVPEPFAVDFGRDTGEASRTLSGDLVNGFEVFQAFDLGEATDLSRIDLSGWTVHHHPSGFTMAIFPDDGTGESPDESSPIASAVTRFRFSSAWVSADLDVALPGGRHWVRVSANDISYDGAVNVGTSGPASFSRATLDGEIFPSSFSIALRLLDANGLVSVPGEGPGSTPGAVSITPNPASSLVVIGLPAAPGRSRVALFDAGGRLVRQISGDARAGTLTVRWDLTDASGRRIAPGVYFARTGRAAARLVVR